MVGSMERYFTLASACPSVGEGTGASVSCRSPGASSPLGRERSIHWRFTLDICWSHVRARFQPCRKCPGIIAALAPEVRPTLANPTYPVFRLRNPLKRNILIRNFRPGPAAGSAAEIVGMAARLNVFSAARSASACATGSRSGSSGIAAAAEHAEVVGHNLKAGALLAFLVLPFAGLDAALD